ncbi:BOS complex subunit NOMO1 [Ciona intestinalis]
MSSPFISLVLGIISTLFYFTTNVHSQEILGCGGFVKSDVPIDFSKIEIQLVTSEGMLKYQAECAPNNGYFMVPFVEKGNFQLKIKPPQGWTFDPMSVELQVDGVSDPCTMGKDINFVFKGFTLSGKVLSLGSLSSGPQGVKVDLKSSSKLILTTTTTDGGSFNFDGISAGSYKIVASHQSYTFKQDETSVVVTNGNKVCDNEIIVSGYDVHGKVTARKLPVAGVNLLLFAKKAAMEKITGCSTNRPHGSKGVTSGEYPTFLCSVSSDTNGEYSFPSLPPSDYLIIPFHRGERIQFDVEPRELKFSVVDKRVVHEHGFKVTGFSVQGRVLDALDGKPIEGAEVLIKGDIQDKTDGNGYYTLKHMNSGMYDVEVRKEDIHFPSTKLRVGPDTPILPNIIAESFSLCGRVSITDNPTSNFKKSQIVVEVTTKNENKNKKTSLDKNGGFCVMVEPGVYDIKPVTTKSMSDGGLVILPTTRQVTISNAPIKDVSFKQYHGSFSVVVSCIAACDDVTITVVADGRAGMKPFMQKIASKESKATVQFSEVLPGDYTVKVSHTDWCWHNDITKVSVSSQPMKSVPQLGSFEQSGFALVCSISHDIGLEIHHAGEKVDVFSLKKGRNRLCLAELGEYLLQPQSCHQFDVKTPLRYNTAHPRPVTLHAIAHQALVTMETSHVIKPNAKSEDKVAVEMKTSKGKTSTEYMVMDGNSTTGLFPPTQTHTYKARYWAGDGEKLEFIPKSKILLFEPQTFSTTMKAAECAKELVRFKGIVGKFISGQISPPLENVDIMISMGDDVTGIKTDKKGKYRHGPVHPEASYNIHATMDDYAFSPVQDKYGDFHAKKLSKLHFEVRLLCCVHQVLGGVLHTRFNIHYVLFYQLPSLTVKLLLHDILFTNPIHLTQEPGQYYFKAMMKEYQFDPSSKVIDVVEGKETKLEIIGNRVAYSCHGSVTSLNGEPEPDCVVRAKVVSGGDHCAGHIEEATVGVDGAYRVRGLRPGCHYDITVRDSANRFSRLSPDHVTLETKKEDVRGLRFIAFRHMTGFELTGRVVTEQEFLPFIKMVLYQSSDATPIHTMSLTRASPFFTFPSLPRDESEYVIRLESTLASSMYEYTTPAAGFFTKGPHKHITLRFQPKLKSMEPETPQVSLLTLPVTLVIGLLAYNYLQVFEFLQKLFSMIVGKLDNPEVSTRSARKSRK